ncbi:MAG: hypothetical protein KDA60_01905, partial [Planctomycetales bacterium]|nr:hypothetical protein [Planctomycetales bacterium]
MAIPTFRSISWTAVTLMAVAMNARGGEPQFRSGDVQPERMVLRAGETATVRLRSTQVRSAEPTSQPPAPKPQTRATLNVGQEI